MNVSLLKTKPQVSSASPAWRCVVTVDQCYREKSSGVLFDVPVVRELSLTECHTRGIAWPNAAVTLRPVECTNGSEDRYMSASALCGSGDWERLPDDDAETMLWGGGTKVGLGGP